MPRHDTLPRWGWRQGPRSRLFPEVTLSSSKAGRAQSRCVGQPQPASTMHFTASKDRARAPAAKRASSQAAMFPDLPPCTFMVWKASSQISQTTNPTRRLLSQAADEDKRGGDLKARALPVHLLGMPLCQAGFSGSPPWPEHMLLEVTGPFFIMIHWVQWHLPNWSQPRRKEVGRGISALKWIAPLGWPRGKFSSIWMDRSGCQTMWDTHGERRLLLNLAPELAWPCRQPWPALGSHFAQDHHIFVRNIGRSPDGKRGCSAFYSFLPSFEFCLFFSNLWKLCPSLSLLLLALPPCRWRKNLFKHPFFPTFLGPWDWLTSSKARRWQKDDFSILNNYSSSWIWQRRWVIWKLVYSHPNMALLFPPAPHTPLRNLLHFLKCSSRPWFLGGLPHKVKTADERRASARGLQ